MTTFRKLEDEVDCAKLLVGLMTGLLLGVSARTIFLDAYMSAVAGRASSGRLGRRKGADDKSPVPVVVLKDASGGLETGCVSVGNCP